MAGCRVAVVQGDLLPPLADSVRAGGATIVEPEEAEGLVWAEVDGPDRLRAILDDNPAIRWVQLPMAGIDRFIPLLDTGRTWTSGKGLYDQPVAELALALLLAGLRDLPRYARTREWRVPDWDDTGGGGLTGARVTLLGAGGIAHALLALLGPFDVDLTIVRHRPQPMDGVQRVAGPEDLLPALEGANGVVVALALTPETEGIIGARELKAMGRDAFLVNIARGRHVVTPDLVDALERDVIGGAGLDVTDPEPLPEDHPLWSLPNCLITPHVGGHTRTSMPALAARVQENVRRFCQGTSLLGLVDPTLGY